MGIIPYLGKNLQEINVYPNPIKDQFSFDLKEEDLKSKITILDATGKECKDVPVTIESTTATANLESKNNGIYFLIINNDGVIKSTKIIKE